MACQDHVLYVTFMKKRGGGIRWMKDQYVVDEELMARAGG